MSGDGRHQCWAAAHDLADLPVEVLANGWDNLVCRLGEEFLVRLPRRATAAEFLAHEQRRLPELADRLPLPVPAPVRLGRPTAEYPWSWSVMPFPAGRIAARSEPDGPWSAAATIGGFLDALHAPAVSEAAVNAARGIPLAGHAEGVLTGLAHVDPADRATALRMLLTSLYGRRVRQEDQGQGKRPPAAPLPQWDMTSQFPQLDTGSKDDANLGFEGVGYVPDSWMTANGWTDPLTHAAYNPANYPLHGSGLYFAGTYTMFGNISTGKAAVMDVTFDAGTQRIIATCDNTCGETHT
ncbi:phosphotransferase [Streptomyces sp. NPDC047841]|uniref:phosphotransferase n=1 Tax=Streptomyces sp. NPDC047841 TaxID=3154708 RepID=UPI003454D6C1